ERVLYFASYLVSQVDEEARTRALQEINDVHEETIEELRLKAQDELDDISERVGGQIKTLTEGEKSLTSSVEERRQGELATLREEYDARTTRLRDLLNEAAPEGLTFRGETIVRESEMVNDERIAELRRVYEAEAEKIESSAQYEASGGSALAGAERDH